jgi:hypothetical protein
MLGYLHWIVPRECVSFLAGESSLSHYRWGTGVADHMFCPRCGVQPIYVPRSHPQDYSVNLRCMDRYPDIAEGMTLRDFDGRNWEDNIESIR